MPPYAYYEYLPFDGESFFTMILLPKAEGTFPTVVCRSPYVKSTVEQGEEAVLESCLQAHKNWLARGYAIVYQHCRGQGKSTGAFVPYVQEREDGLALRKWIREQSFYNGSLFLMGGSYTASLHYATAPFEEDIRAAVFEVQDTERYRLWYRNGQMRKGHANWHFGLYKSKCNLPKQFDMRSFSQLPLAELSTRVLGDRAEDFEQMLDAPKPTDGFWCTRYGGNDTKGATDHANIPMLLTTGYNDFYLGGLFRMWESMDRQTKRQSALLVSPYHHGDGYDKVRGLAFANGKRSEQFGSTYAIDWFDHVQTGSKLPFEKGVITYYRAFENRWQSDFYATDTQDALVVLGDGTQTICYDPQDPPAFCEEGICDTEQPDRADVISVCTKPFDEDRFIKGRMRARLTVSSNCADSSFYIRISLKNAQHTYVLRHDITSLCYQLGDYQTNSVVQLEFTFDEYAFLLKKGECLRLDISATDNNTYVSHTNQKGAYAKQTSSVVAHNRVYLDRSVLILPIERT